MPGRDPPGRDPPGLDPTERALLAQIAGGDDAACDVLADHWAERGDPARGAFLRVQRARAAAPSDPELRAAERELLERHAERWLAPALAAGFARTPLSFERGFLRAAPVLAPGEDADELLRLSPVIYRELGRADCNGRVFEARAELAGGAPVPVLLKTVMPHWPQVAQDDDIGFPSATNRLAMRGYALRREDAPTLALVLPGGTHLSNVLGVRSWSDPEHEPRPRGRPLGLPFAIAVTCATCRALQALHAAGAWHGALTPENILLGEGGGVHVLDLYPSKHLFDTFMPWTREQSWHLSSEQAVGLASDARSDVFALALVLCTLVGGEHPLAEHVGLYEILRALRDRRLVLPAGLPPEIERVLHAALAEPARRYPDAAAFGAALAGAAEAARVPCGPEVIAAALGYPGAAWTGSSAPGGSSRSS